MNRALPPLLRRIPGWQRLRRRLRAQAPRVPVTWPHGRRFALPAAEPAADAGAVPATFVLYRIIGNDLVPRHARGQSRANLRFLLDHEPELRCCEKRFVLNRIVDPDEEAAMIEQLEAAGRPWLRLPFAAVEYGRREWDISGVGLAWAPHTRAFAALDATLQERILARVYRHRNQYVMNNNGARNAALADGRGRARWVLPFDGNCFFTAAAWEELVAAVEARPDLPYHVVPMARITDNQRLLDPQWRPAAPEEPQILFRHDAAECFDEAFFYGERPKVELLWRLAVPGPWECWPLRPWDLPCPAPAAEAGRVGRAGWVARLDSGRGALEGAGDRRTLNDRGQVRRQAVRAFLDRLDGLYSPPRLAPERPPRRPPEPALRGALADAAEAALARGPYSVVDKTSLPPSGDRHDYWHPAPYYWPNPIPLPGLPYVQRDGRRVPGTRLYEPEAERYDRTRLQRLFDDTRVLTLAAEELAEERYARHAAGLIRTWFLDPATAMNPHLDYAQVRQGHNGNRGTSSGIIEFKDLHFLLPAVCTLAARGTLAPAELERLGDWLRRYLDWLQNSPQGRRERSAANNHGTCHDLQVASIAAFLGDYFTLRDTLRDSRFRILEQFRGDGSQPEEMRRTLTAHYCCFNLQAWVHLAELAAAHGEDLWGFTGDDGAGLERAFAWLLTHIGRPWPYRQIESFDPERFYPLFHACRQQYGVPAGVAVAAAPPPAAIRALFHPHDGIRPFWQLALRV